MACIASCSAHLGFECFSWLGPRKARLQPRQSDSKLSATRLVSASGAALSRCPGSQHSYVGALSARRVQWVALQSLLGALEPSAGLRTSQVGLWGVLSPGPPQRGRGSGGPQGAEPGGRRGCGRAGSLVVRPHGSYLDELSVAGECAAEYLALYQKLIASAHWKVYLAARGALPYVGSLITKVCRPGPAWGPRPSPAPLLSFSI